MESDGIVFRLLSDPINGSRYHATLKAKEQSPTMTEGLCSLLRLCEQDYTASFRRRQP
jgi:hypothetical protein